jgi:hypothetical protein
MCMRLPTRIYVPMCVLLYVLLYVVCMCMCYFTRVRAYKKKKARVSAYAQRGTYFIYI